MDWMHSVVDEFQFKFTIPQNPWIHRNRQMIRSQFHKEEGPPSHPFAEARKGGHG